MLIESRPELVFNCGRFAVSYGPVIYCGESVDNGKNIRDIRISAGSKFARGVDEGLGVPTLTVDAYRRTVDDSTPIYRYKQDEFTKIKLKLIPYYAFANRGECEMQIWFFVK